MNRHEPHQPPVHRAETIDGLGHSTLQRYLRRVGESGWPAYLRSAAIQTVAQRRRGATGIALRRLLYPHLFAAATRPVVLEDVTVRGPRRIRLGDRVMIEHRVTLDVKTDRHEGLSIGDRSVLRTGTVIDTGYHGWVRLGADVSIGPGCELRGFGGLTLEDGALLAGGCFLAPGHHRFDEPGVPVTEQDVEEDPIRIGAGAWLGAGVFVGGGVDVGDHAVVGAGSVVTRDVPPGAVVVGAPARILRWRPGFPGRSAA